MLKELLTALALFYGSSTQNRWLCSIRFRLETSGKSLGLIYQSQIKSKNTVHNMTKINKSERWLWSIVKWLTRLTTMSTFDTLSTGLAINRDMIVICVRFVPCLC